MSLTRTCLVLSTLCLLSAVCGCQAGSGATHSGTPRIVSAASKETQAATLSRIASLKGTWENISADGNPIPPEQRGTITFTPTSNGSAVREIMFPGTPQEMTNMYHMDGSDLIVTHYCAMGNQPRMRCTKAGTSEIAFGFDSATNVRSNDEECMGELTIRFLNPNTIEEVWISNKGGVKTSHAVFTLQRKGA